MNRWIRCAGDKTTRLNREAAPSEHDETADVSHQSYGAIWTQLSFGAQQIAGQTNQAAAQVHLRRGDGHGPRQAEWGRSVDEARRLKEKVGTDRDVAAVGGAGFGDQPAIVHDDEGWRHYGQVA